MKRLMTIMALSLTLTMQGLSQGFNYNKITPDLLEEINGSTKSGEMFQTIVFLNEQFDAQKLTRQMQHFSKVQQREYVMNELQQVSRIGQTAILKDLHQGQKAELVEDIQSFWIINAIGCSMTKDMVYAIAERPDVKFVMKDYEIHVADCEVSKNNQHDRSSDPWNVGQVHAPEVWNLGYTGQGIIVAVIDSGVNYNHTDIANNMWDGGDEYPNHGWDFVNNDNDPMDDVDHGTHCAGTVSSYGTNGKQCGIAKDAKIMALKTLKPKPNGSGGTGSTTDGWAAIEFAVSHGADILSMSLGSAGKGGNWAYRAVMENALHCGVIASVSAGNVGNDLTNYPIPNNVGSPGNCPSPWRHPDQTLDGGRSAVVAVGATTSKDNHSSFSSCGPSTWASGEQIGYYEDYPWTEGDPTNIGLIKPDISAPGSSILSLSHTSNSEYCSMSGTSMAAPCVSGVIALMLSANPTLTPVEIDSIIETTAIPCGGQTSKNNTFGAGRIDALAAINYMLNACNAPTNLTATASGANVTLYWDEASGINTYRVYRNGTMIAKSVSGTTYYDENAPAGTNVYFVRSNGENHKASMPSNQVSVNINTNIEIAAPSNLSMESIGENNVTLNWETPEPQVKTLCYSESETDNYTGTGEDFITGQRFPSSMLQQFNGMQIEHIYFSVYNSDVECTINLYEGDAMQPSGTPIYSGSITSTEEEQAIDYAVNPPVIVNSSKDLWLTITMTDYILVDNEYDSQGNGDAFMFRQSSNNFWMSNLGRAWKFKIGFSNGEYSYNVYRNGQVVSSNQSTTSFTGNLVEGINEYHVNSISNGYESTGSNAIKIIRTGSIQENVVLNEDDKLVVLPNSTLTVTEALTNDNPENLILENGAQLIHSSEGVKATVKKAITPYQTNMDGWNFITLPVAESFTPSADNSLLNGDYDLYYYDEPEHHWRNYRKNNFDLAYKQGYLYANKTETTLQFEGTLTPSNSTISITGLSHSAETLNGFNLLGNPFACNATVDQDCYVISGRQVILANSAPTLAPCEGVMVKADSDLFTVTFTKASGAKGDSNGKSLDLVVTQGKSTLDRARVRLGEGTNMEKFTLDGDGGTQLTLWQDGQDYAVAYTNGLSELPLNFKASENGSYSIGIEANSLDLDYLHLIDNLTGADIDLLSPAENSLSESGLGGVYTFTAKTTDYVSRFRLVFSNCEDEIGDNDDNAPFAYISNGEVIIIHDGDAMLQIVDMTGRLVDSERLSNRGSRTIGGIPSGMYVLRLIDSDSIKTQKIVIE